MIPNRPRKAKPHPGPAPALCNNAVLAAFAAAAYLAAAPALAQNGDAVRAAACPDPALSPFSQPAPDRSGAPIVMHARTLDARKTETSEARGDVEIIRADQRLTSERVSYSPGSRKVMLPEPLEYSDAQVWIRAQEAEYSFIEESGYFSKVEYGLTESSANGSAESVRLEPGRRSVLSGLDFTTCPGERPDWEIKAKEMELRHDEGVGIARHARLEFQGVPILYAPWFSFPIDDRRKTGLLYPSVSNTNDNGLEIGVPWYWNIAPNMDATIEPHHFTDRGSMLTGEYRFLSRRTVGFIDFDYMPDDEQTGEERYHYRFNQHALIAGSWSSDLFVDRVSDDRYFQDFGASLAVTSRQYVRTGGILRGFGQYWSFEVLADDFQVIDEAVTPENEPYRRLPRIIYQLDRPLGPGGFGVLLDSELSYFDRDLGVTGARMDFGGHLYWERYATWGFIRPSLGYRYTGYQLDDTEPDADTSPDRGTTIASLDGGLFFDRVLDSGDSQTLEPRLFYLYVPFEEQSTLPDFDAGEFTFGFSQLFNTNRFTGADRQADADQLSVSLTTRTLSGRDGNELWRFSLGQIFYFDDRRVQLDDNPAMSEDVSPFIAEFRLSTFRRFSATAGLQWDWQQDRFDVASFGVGYGGEEGERAAFEYRFRRDRVDQFDLRLLWPMNERWTVLSRVNYSFEDSDLLETQAGFEYESCCWALRTVYRRYLKNRFGNHRDGIYLELNLKGLASVGTGGEDLFYY